MDNSPNSSLTSLDIFCHLIRLKYMFDKPTLEITKFPWMGHLWVNANEIGKVHNDSIYGKYARILHITHKTLHKCNFHQKKVSMEGGY